MIQSNPKISIIVPVYNLKDYVREALDSVCAQTIADWECICVDDGSTDGTGMILDEYACRDARFHVIHQSNQGVSVARNVAIQAAKGRWICFLDGDDVLLPNYLKEVLAVLESKDTSIEFDFKNWLEQCLSDGHVCTIFVRNQEPYNQHCFPVGLNLREDTVYILGFLREKKGACLINTPSYVYRHREGSASTNVYPTQNAVLVHQAIERDWGTHPDKEQVLRAVAAQHPFYTRLALRLSLRFNSLLPAKVTDGLLRFQYAVKQWVRRVCA